MIGLALQVVVGYPVAKSVMSGRRDSFREEQEAAPLHISTNSHFSRMRMDWSPWNTQHGFDGACNAALQRPSVSFGGSCGVRSENASSCGVWRVESLALV
jgi:hypothetical protein